MEKKTKKATSYRLSPVGLGLIEKLAKKKGLSNAGVIELAIRELAERENVKSDS